MAADEEPLRDRRALNARVGAPFAAVGADVLDGDGVFDSRHLDVRWCGLVLGLINWGFSFIKWLLRWLWF